MPVSMRGLQDTSGILSLPLIAYNGSLIMDGDQVLRSLEFDHRLLLAIKSYCQGTGIHLSLYHHDDWFVPEMDYWAQREQHNTKVNPVVMDFESVSEQWQNTGNGWHKVMCMGEENEIEQLYQTLTQNHSEDLNLYRSKSTYIEVSDKRIDKASALEFLLQSRYPQITMDQVIAFGDNYNDSNLLREVGLGVAVANAKHEVLALADRVTNSNVEDGVAAVLKEYFLT